MITLSDGLTTLPLPDLDWLDEFEWSPVVQTAEYSLTGALLVELATRQAGRPITLASAADRAVVTRSAVEALAAWAAQAGLTLTLTVRGMPRAVLFAHQGQGLEAQPLFGWSNGQPGEFYRITLRFLEI